MRRVFGVVGVLLLAVPVSAQFKIPNQGDASNVTQAVPMSVDFDDLVAGIGGTGVVSGAAVSPGTGMILNVASGVVRIVGADVSVSAGNVMIGAAHATFPRIDLVVVNSSGVKSVVAGTAAASPAAPTIPASSVLLAMVYVPANDTAIGAEQITDKRVPTPPGITQLTGDVTTASGSGAQAATLAASGVTPGTYGDSTHAPVLTVDAKGRITAATEAAIVGGGGGSGALFELSIEDYGAVCDGTTDDAAAIQDAIDAVVALGGGMILWPPRTCAIASSIVLGDSSGGMATTFVGIRGAGPATSTLRWNGATNGTAVRIVRNKYFHIEGIGFRNNVAMGTTIGLIQTGYGGIGTETLGGLFTGVHMSGFNICMQAGDPTSGGTASSDIHYRFVEFESCGTGWVNYDLNTLNHVFDDFNAVGNTIGLNARIGNVYVRGGSSANNDTVFKVSADHFTLRDFRAEVSTGDVMIDASGLGYNITIDAVTQANPADTTTPALKFPTAGGAVGSSVTITDSRLGRIDMSAGFGPSTMRITNSFIAGESDFPVYLNGAAPNFFNLDYEGVFNATANVMYDDTKVEWKNTIPFVTSRTRQRRLNADFAPGLDLRRVQSISGGQAATASPGKNFRLQWKFASSATAAVTFKHTITGNVNGGVTNVDTGTIYAGDIGRPVKVTVSGADNYGYISSVPSASTFTWTINGGVHDACGVCAGTGDVTALIGEDEPDATYFLAVSCNAAGEQISWSSKATTGFTLTSSNATSTALCDILVYR